MTAAPAPTANPPSRPPGEAAPAAAPVLTLSQPALRLVVALADGLIIALALLLATALRKTDLDVDRLPEQAIVVCGLMVSALAAHDAYEFQMVRSGQDLLTRLLVGAGFGLVLVMIGSFVMPDLAVGRGVFILLGAISIPLLLVWRRFVFRTVRESALRPRAVVLGEAAVAAKVARAAVEAQYGGAEVVGILVPAGPDGAPASAAPATPGAPPILGTYAALRAVVEAERVTQAIVVTGRLDERLPVDDVIALRQRGLRIEDGAVVYESITGKILIEKLTPGWLVFANAFERSALERRMRRAIGIVVAGLGLVAISPLLALVAAAVKLDSPGPILFRQRRVGEGGKLFDVLKFRSMRRDAEAKTGAVWAVAGDPRVTRVGRIMRSTRLDELPQLWNVVRGDMFFVGPRPERPEFVEKLRQQIPYYDERHRVKPGITGWAQINYRYGATVEDTIEKLHFDLYYIQNLSLLVDLDIVLGTIRVMLGASNSN